MAKYICSTCQFIYDEYFGGPTPGIEPGTKWEDLPETWHCPQCGDLKHEFEKVQEKEQ
ncbi:MAG: rubredoxin [Clostridiales bacterium]|jgi:rubredoxin|nr:rubredoxin [Clostridiales bacterium]